MSINNLDEVMEHINLPFGFLLKKGFKVHYSDFPNHFDNFIVVIEVPEFRVRFTRDRSTISIQVSPHQAEDYLANDKWYSLIGIIMFLTHNQVLISGYWKDRFDADKQLERLAKAFHHYYDNIVELFRPDNFQKQKANVDLVCRDVTSLLYDPQREYERLKLEEQALLFWQTMK